MLWMANNALDCFGLHLGWVGLLAWLYRFVYLCSSSPVSFALYGSYPIPIPIAGHHHPLLAILCAILWACLQLMSLSLALAGCVLSWGPDIQRTNHQATQATQATHPALYYYPFSVGESWLKRSIIVMLQILWQMTVFACNHNFRVATVGKGTPPLATSRPLQPSTPPICVCEHHMLLELVIPTPEFSFSVSHTLFTVFPTRFPLLFLVVSNNIDLVAILWRLKRKKLHSFTPCVAGAKRALGLSDFKDAHHHHFPSPTRCTSTPEIHKHSYAGLS